MRKNIGSTRSIEKVYEVVREHSAEAIEYRQLALPYESVQLKILLNLFALQGRLGREEADLYHIIGDVHYAALVSLSHKTILTIHDCEMLARYRALRRYLLSLFWFRMPIQTGVTLVTVSEATRQDLRRTTGYTGPIQVIHNPLQALFDCPTPLPENETFRLLQIGTKHNKNIERIAEAVRGLDLELVIVGRLRASQERALRENAVRYQNPVDLDDLTLREWYQRSDAVIVASTKEGFGIPVIEAQGVGRPVIASNLSSLPEVAGAEGAIYVDPYALGSIRQGVEKIMIARDLRLRLVEQGYRNIRRFRAEVIARQYVEVYRKCLQ